MEDKRVLKINPMLFSLSNNTTRKKMKKPENDGEGIRIRNTNRDSKNKAETIKNKSALLRMLRHKQEEKYKSMMENGGKIESDKNDYIEEFNSDFQEAKDFMDNLSKKGGDKNSGSGLVNNYQNKNTNSLLYSQSLKNQLDIEKPIEYISDYINRRDGGNNHYNPPQQQQQQQQQQSTAQWQPIVMNPQNVSYNPVNQANINIPTIPINTKSPSQIMEDKINESIKRVTEMKETAAKLEEFREKERPKIKKQKKTRTRTYKIGKSKVIPKVSVLVSNRTIRNNVSSKTQLLKQIPIQEVKKYLMKRGFIKVGSIAPNDVLRKMYESSILICGELQNHNPENLLYNFMNNEND